MKEECKLPAARMVIIELDPRNIRKFSSQMREHGEEAFAKAVAMRVKYEFLLEKVVVEGYVGTFPKEIVWEGAGLAWDTNYKVITTEPKGDVQITSKTTVVCRLPK